MDFIKHTDSYHCQFQNKYHIILKYNNDLKIVKIISADWNKSFPNIISVNINKISPIRIRPLPNIYATKMMTDFHFTK